MKNWLFATFVLLSACAPSSQDAIGDIEDSYQIIGGQRVDQKDDLAKSVVNIGKYCTGTIIAKDAILTAAHCFADKPNVKIAMLFGLSTDISKGQKMYGKQLFNGFEECGRDCDVAIIKLDGQIPEGYKPISVNFYEDVVQSGITVDAYGYGQVSVDGNLADGLMKTKLKVIQLFRSTVMTEQSKTSGVYHGDSGGPIFAQYQGKNLLVGVISGVDSQSTTSGFHIRTSAREVKDFILKHVPSLVDADAKPVAVK